MDYLNLTERLDRIESLLSTHKAVLTFDEACDYTGISRSYMYKLTASGKIPYSKPNGKLIFFEKDKLNTWLLQNGRKSDNELQSEALKYSMKNRRF